MLSTCSEGNICKTPPCCLLPQSKYLSVSPQLYELTCSRLTNKGKIITSLAETIILFYFASVQWSRLITKTSWESHYILQLASLYHLFLTPVIQKTSLSKVVLTRFATSSSHLRCNGAYMPCVLRNIVKSSFIWFSAHCTQNSFYNEIFHAKTSLVTSNTNYIRLLQKTNFFIIQ